VSAAGFGSQQLDVVGPPFNGYSEHVVELQRVVTGSLVLNVGDGWEDARVSFHGQDMGRPRGRWHDVVDRARREASRDGVSFDAPSADWVGVLIRGDHVLIADLPVGDYRGTIELTAPGEVPVEVPFEARIEANATCERTISVR
jgi:hypothetical protein